MPPSINSCYVNVGRKRVASRELKNFKRKATAWGILNKPHLKKVREEVTEYLDKSKLCMHFYFRFPQKKLWLKSDKKPRKLDASNRIKPAEDKVCDMLGFDDRYVYRVIAEKIIGETEEFGVFIYAYD